MVEVTQMFYSVYLVQARLCIRGSIFVIFEPKYDPEQPRVTNDTPDREFSAVRPAVQQQQTDTGSARRAASECVINAMNTSRLFLQASPPGSNGRNGPDLRQFAQRHPSAVHKSTFYPGLRMHFSAAGYLVAGRDSRDVLPHILVHFFKLSQPWRYIYVRIAHGQLYKIYKNQTVPLSSQRLCGLKFGLKYCAVVYIISRYCMQICAQELTKQILHADMYPCRGSLSRYCMQICAHAGAHCRC